jgi:hypothetical protein
MKEEKNETQRVGGEPPLAEYSASLGASNKNSEANAESKPAGAAPPWDTKRDLSTLILDMTFNLAVELEHANKKIEELEMKLANTQPH